MLVVTERSCAQEVLLWAVSVFFLSKIQVVYQLLNYNRIISSSCKLVHVSSSGSIIIGDAKSN